jgi:magnesium transporter
MAEVSAVEVEGMITARDWRGVRRELSERPAPEVADLLLDLERPNRVVAFRVLPRMLSAEVFSHLESEDQNLLLQDMGTNETRQLLSALDPDDRTHLFEEMPGEVTQKLLNLLAPDELTESRALLGYPEESVGRLMTPKYVAVRPEWTIARALDQIRRHGRRSETINTIFVVDRRWKLLDALEVRAFILRDPIEPVEEIMDHTFTSITAIADREDAVNLIQRYDLEVLPVVDTEGVLIGIVTVDDVLDVAEEEATEDFHKTAAVAPLRTSYRHASVLNLIQRRIGWLLALIVVNLLSSGVIAANEETLQATIALAFFIPLLIDSGGNAGAQAATLMVRGIATGDVDLNGWANVVGKEVAVGSLLGLAMGIGGSLLGLIRGGWEVGLVVGLAMVCIVIVANLIGTILPFILTRLGKDPAVASSPLITSISDFTGLLIYFGIATLILSPNG